MKHDNHYHNSIVITYTHINCNLELNELTAEGIGETEKYCNKKRLGLDRPSLKLYSWLEKFEEYFHD